jgi:transcriptional regulator with XRE-family HTH domain
VGQKRRYKPKHLGAKLLAIRRTMKLSQSQMVAALGCDGVTTARISEYEHNLREPNLFALLRYGRISGVSVDALIDDELRPSQLVIAEHYLDSL